MFTKLVRDFKIWKNHRRRVNSIVLRSNEEIVRALDLAKAQYLKAERLEDKDTMIECKGAFNILEWLINETE